MAKTGSVRYYSVSELEAQMGSRSISAFVQSCESRLMKELQDLAYRIAWNPAIRAVFVAGPSSSGKTTFTHRLQAGLKMHGRETFTLSLDDYYRDQPQLVYHEGRPDFESIDSLDQALMLEQIQALLAGETVRVPSFDFAQRKRCWEPERAITLPPNAVLLVEGLHGLSHDISGQLANEARLRIMLTPWASLVSDRRLLEARDIRILRRISRDVLHRGTHALATLDYWPMMDRVEEAIFPAYLESADVFVNTALLYEFLVIPQLAAKAIQRDLLAYEEGRLRASNYVEPGLYYADLPAALKEARRLLEACQELPSISPSHVPEQSILNEFIS